MSQTVFYPRLNDFCRTYLLANRQLSPSELVEFPTRLKDEQGALFEHLMLFDKISFKVYGENIPASFLLNLFGDYTFEALIEQGAIGFTLWTPVVTYMATEVQGIDPLQYGTVSSASHSDPEKSIDLGLSWKDPAPSAARRKYLNKLLLTTL